MEFLATDEVRAALQELAEAHDLKVASLSGYSTEISVTFRRKDPEPVEEVCDVP